MNAKQLLLGLVVTAGLAIAGVVTFAPAAFGAADDGAAREIEALKRQVSELAGRVEKLEDRLEAREKAIAVSSSGVTIKASRVAIDAGFELALDANTIRLNGGRNPVARVGSKIDAERGVTDGARNILVP
jgi:outer membrane murein-binding lipoprotein Lpp